MNIAVVGATGMVGQNFLALLQKKAFPLSQVRLFASSKSQGQKIPFLSKTFVLEALSDEVSLKQVDIAFFSAGEDISRTWAPRFVTEGALVIDNSSAFRMKKHIPLVVPEVNGEQITKKGIIANPNCSTIQLVMVLNQLNRHFGLESVHISSYQSVSGAGRPALKQLIKESKALLNSSDKLFSASKIPPFSKTESASLKEKGGCELSHTADIEEEPVFASLPANSKSVAFNCIPQIGTINQAGFSTEEWKLMRETKKILQLPNLTVTATAVRVPVFNGHGEAVLLTLGKPANKKEVKLALAKQKGLTLLEGDSLPHQRFVDGKEDVYVGRIRPVPTIEDMDQEEVDNPSKKGSLLHRRWMMWIAGDNLKKGSALNGLQIAQTLL